MLQLLGSENVTKEVFPAVIDVPPKDGHLLGGSLWSITQVCFGLHALTQSKIVRV
jgi:hypothetical protein